MTELTVFWHRRDLRVDDNLGLAAARKNSAKLVGVFCFDPDILQRDDVAPARVVYLLGCLEALQQRYEELNSQLFFLQGSPKEQIVKFAKALGVRTVYWGLDVEPYAQTRDHKVMEALKEEGIIPRTCWDQLLHYPGSVLTQSGEKPYVVYTPFWKNWRDQPKLVVAPDIEPCESLTDSELSQLEEVDTIALPSAKDLGYEWSNSLLLEPGEGPARDRLAKFCRRSLTEYQNQRNLPSVDGTSLLSAPLKFGAIGIRRIWQTVQAVYDDCRSDEARQNVQTYQQELAWREFYQHALFHYPELADNPYRDDVFADFPWEDNAEHFQAWCEGKTGYPIVDAAMRQLNETGWMHNRCRMIVASFLTKDLIINWQWGEKYFMQKLFDGDLSANNGGWQWSASCGLDPKPLRIFNPFSQAQRYDSDAEYIRQWLPELRSLDTPQLLKGNIKPLEREQCGYVEAIVDHSEQQREFKRRYQAQKAD